MKIFGTVLAGLILVAGLAGFAATASATPLQPGVFTASAATPVRTLRVTLPSAQCADVRRSLRNPAASCAAMETIHVSAISTSGSTTYYAGVLGVCAKLENGKCTSSPWFVTDEFTFTVNTSTEQAWNNGTPTCYHNGTDVDWCSYTGNGTYTLSEGFNFDANKAYARMWLYGDAGWATGPGYSWMNETGTTCVIPTQCT